MLYNYQKTTWTAASVKLEFAIITYDNHMWKWHDGSRQSKLDQISNSQNYLLNRLNNNEHYLYK